jgi:IS4 transposase
MLPKTVRFPSPTECAAATIKLNSAFGRRDYPDKLRRISYVESETGNCLVLLTNRLALEAILIARIHRRRQAIELFFRWKKPPLGLRGFYSDSFSGVRVQL